MAAYRMRHEDSVWYVIEKKVLFRWRYEKTVISSPEKAQKDLEEYVKNKSKIYYAKAKKTDS